MAIVDEALKQRGRMAPNDLAQADQKIRAPRPATPAPTGAAVAPATAPTGAAPAPAPKPDQLAQFAPEKIEYQPILNETKPEELVQGQLKNILSADNPLMQGARARAMQAANARGLQNSSMAAQAGEEAAIQSALPIAQADAQAIQKQRLVNQDIANQFLSQKQGAQLNLEAAYAAFKQNNFMFDKEETLRRYLNDSNISSQEKINALRIEADKAMNAATNATNITTTGMQTAASERNAALAAQTNLTTTQMQTDAQRFATTTQADTSKLIAEWDNANKIATTTMQEEGATARQTSANETTIAKTNLDNAARLAEQTIASNATIAAAGMSAGASTEAARINAEAAADRQLAQFGFDKESQVATFAHQDAMAATQNSQVNFQNYTAQLTNIINTPSEPEAEANGIKTLTAVYQALPDGQMYDIWSKTSSPTTTSTTKAPEIVNEGTNQTPENTGGGG